jgi:hypothetical protein
MDDRFARTMDEALMGPKESLSRPQKRGAPPGEAVVLVSEANGRLSSIEPLRGDLRRGQVRGTHEE